MIATALAAATVAMGSFSNAKTDGPSNNTVVVIFSMLRP